MIDTSVKQLHMLRNRLYGTGLVARLEHIDEQLVALYGRIRVRFHIVVRLAAREADIGEPLGQALEIVQVGSQ